MVLTIRKERNKYHLVEKETGKIKRSFETKEEALDYKAEEVKEKPKKGKF